MQSTTIFEKYIDENVIEEFPKKGLAKILEKRVRGIVNRWMSDVREMNANHDFPSKATFYTRIDKPCWPLFHHFLKRPGLNLTVGHQKTEFQHDLFPGLLDNSKEIYKICVKLFWVPDDPRLFGNCDSWKPKKEDFTPSSRSILNKDWEETKKEDGSWDITFKVEQETFHAHKGLLTLRSPYFKTIFDSRLKDSQETAIEIKETSPKAFGALLQYLYTGDVDNCVAESLSDLIETLFLAKQDMEEGLIPLCFGYISLLVMENPIERKSLRQLLELASSHQSETLMKSILFAAEKDRDRMNDLISVIDEENFNYTKEVADKEGCTQLPKIADELEKLSQRHERIMAMLEKEGE